MAYADVDKVISLVAGADLLAHRLVYCSASGTANYVTTNSSAPIGVTLDSAYSGGAVSVVVDGVAKCYAYTSITAGNLVCMATDAAGMLQHAHTDCATASATWIPTVGVALETGSNSSLIAVNLKICNAWKPD